MTIIIIKKPSQDSNNSDNRHTNEPTEQNTFGHFGLLSTPQVAKTEDRLSRQKEPYSLHTIHHDERKGYNTGNNRSLSAKEMLVEPTMSPVTIPIKFINYFFAKVHLFFEITKKNYCFLIKPPHYTTLPSVVLVTTL